MPTAKHLPMALWPAADKRAFDLALAPGDIFDETCGPGAHLAEGTRRMITTAYRRWLGYLHRYHQDDLRLRPGERITQAHMRAFAKHLEAEVRATTVAHYINNLHYAAKLIEPSTDWCWLKSIASRLAALSTPEDRFCRLVPNAQVLDLGHELMVEAADLHDYARRARETAYRDGLILALLSLWPIRRRAIASLTISRHVKSDEDGMTLVLYGEDAKSGRSERFRAPQDIASCLQRYLDEMRPAFPAFSSHDGLWASNKGCPLTGGQIYNIVRRHTERRLGKPVSLHDIRRSAATFVAMDAPELVSLIPGVLQHTGPEVSEKHYTLARSVEASHRFNSTIKTVRSDLAIKRKRHKE